MSSIQLSYSVNTIGNIIQEIKTETEQNQRKIRLINEYMETNNISSQLQLQIREYLNYYWREQEAEQHMSQQNEIVNELPEFLKSKLLKEANSHIIQECPFFKRFEFSENFKKDLYKIIYAINLLPESVIENEKQKAGLYGPCIIYIEKGAVAAQAISGNNITIVEEYSEKEYFGFKEFILGSKTNLHYLSTQFSRIFCLPLNQFLDILKDYQEDNERFQDIKVLLEFSPEQVISKIPQQCIACKDTNHILTECGLVHFTPDTERVIKSYVFTQTQHRTQFKRGSRPHSSFSPIFDYLLINEDAVKFEQDNSKFLEALYDHPSDDYTDDESENDEDLHRDTTKDTKVNTENDSNKATNQNVGKLKEIEEVEDEENEEKQPAQAAMRKTDGKSTSSKKRRKTTTKFNTTKNSFSPKKPAVPKFAQKRKEDKKVKQSAVEKQSQAIKQLIRQSLIQQQVQEKKQQIKFTIENAQEVMIREEKLEKIYSQEKLYLTMIERHRFMYFDKMNHFLNNEDLRSLDFLHLRLRVLLTPNIIEQFENYKHFQHYKSSQNLDKVLDRLSTKMIRVKSKQVLQFSLGERMYPGNRFIRLINYLFFPQYYDMKYKNEKIDQTVNSELGDFTDVGGASIKAIKSPQSYSSQYKGGVFTKNQIVPFGYD